MAIDFTAFSRGMERGKESVRRDEEFQFQREQRRQKLEAQSFDQQAATYTSTLLNNMQEAANAGQNDVTFLLKQRAAIQEDPNFQAFRPEVQSQIWAQLNNAAMVTAEQQLRANNPQAARELSMAFGSSAIPESQVLNASGDTNAILGDPRLASRITRDAEGNALIDGQRIDANRLAVVLQQAGPAGIPAALAQVKEEARQAQAQQLLLIQQGQQEGMRYDQLQAMNGFIKQPDGSYLNPTTSVRMPPRPSMLPTGVAPTTGANGGVGANGVPTLLQTSGVTPLNIPGITQPVPAVPAVPAVATTTAAAPAANQPGQDPTLLEAQLEQLPALIAKEAQTQSQLDAATQAFQAIPSAIPRTYTTLGLAGLTGQLKRRAANRADQVRLDTLYDEMQRLKAQLVADQSALKYAQDNRIPDLSQQLRAQLRTGGLDSLPNAGPIVAAFAAAASTLEKAQMLPTQAAVAYMTGIDQRLRQLELKPEATRTPQETQEMATLAKSLDNLRTATYAKSPRPNTGSGGGGR